MKKKIAMSCIALLCASTVLSACASGGNSSESKNGKVKVRFASWDVAEDIDKQQSLVDKFNESHDDIEVVIEAYGRDFEKEGEDFKKNYYSALWDYNSIEGNIYGMPVGFTTHALFYNKDLFEEAGVDLPGENFTWDDLRTTAKTISEKTNAKGFAFQMKPDPYDFEMYLWSNGTAYCDDKGDMKGKIDSQESQEVFKMFQDMAKEEVAAVTEGNGTDEFRAGQVAMYIYGSWSINSLNEDNMNYGITKLPNFGSKPSVSILSSSGIAMSKDSKNKDAAWEFMKYWTGEEANRARIGLELPVLETVIESEKMEDSTYAPFYEMLKQSAGYTPASFIQKNWSEVSENLSLSFEEMFNPSTYKDVKTTLEQAAQQ